MKTAKNVNKVSITSILQKVVLDLKKKKVALLQRLSILAIIMTAFESISRIFIIERGFIALVMFWMLYGMLFTLFAVTCHRIIILGPYSVPVYGLYYFTMREVRFYGWGFVIYFFLSLITFITMFPVSFFSFNAKSNGFLWLFAMYIAIVPGTYIFSRLSLLFPATATDHKKDMKWAWDATKGNGWRLLLLLGVIPVVIGFMTGIFSGVSASFDAALIIAGYIFAVFEIGILSHVYKFLTDEAVYADE
jgi:hypothetical protein